MNEDLTYAENGELTLLCWQHGYILRQLHSSYAGLVYRTVPIGNPCGWHEHSDTETHTGAQRVAIYVKRAHRTIAFERCMRYHPCFPIQ